MRETFKSMIFVTFTHYTVQKVLKLQTATTDSHTHMSNAYCLTLKATVTPYTSHFTHITDNLVILSMLLIL